jgi:hypothetical protein
MDDFTAHRLEDSTEDTNRCIMAIKDGRSRNYSQRSNHDLIARALSDHVHATHKPQMKATTEYLTEKSSSPGEY